MKLGMTPIMMAQMIQLFTDFGWSGPYVGHMKAVIAARAPAIAVVDLMHDAPTFDPRAAAHLLAALTRDLAAGTVLLGVVDPGVGNPARRPIAVEAGARWFVGPDNGLFALAARQWPAAWHEIVWRPDHMSASFHGRDLFAPVAAEIASGRGADLLRPLAGASIGVDWPDETDEIIYIDAFGNAMTGLRAGSVPETAVLDIAGRKLAYARTFSAVPPGAAFWFGNAYGLVELAVNQGRADRVLGVAGGDQVRVA